MRAWFFNRALASKGETKTEMERAEVFEGPGVRIDPIIEANGTDGEFVAQACADGVSHVIEADLFSVWQKISRVGKQRALQFTQNLERVFDIEHGEKFAAHRVTVIIVRTKLALGETSHRRCSAIKETLVDGDRSCLAGAAAIERMNDSRPGAKRERALAEPALQRRAVRLVCRHARRQRLGPKRQIVT